MILVINYTVCDSNFKFSMQKYAPIKQLTQDGLCLKYINMNGCQKHLIHKWIMKLIGLTSYCKILS